MKVKYISFCLLFTIAFINLNVQAQELSVKIIVNNANEINSLTKLQLEVAILKGTTNSKSLRINNGYFCLAEINQHCS